MPHSTPTLLFFLLNELNQALDALIQDGVLPKDIDRRRISLSPAKDRAHGDVATNAAMVLAKRAGMKPRDLANRLGERLAAQPAIDKAEVAGPGFLNLHLARAFWLSQLRAILRVGTNFGRSKAGRGLRVNVEFVSANPTGPMHVGHARGAVVGDVLAALLAKAGFDVTREYYINDAGAQVDVLARSTHLRYREALGETIAAIPEGYYPGAYLKPVGAALAERDGRRWLDQPESRWLEPVRRFAIDAMMAMIREDLNQLGVHHDRFSSERALVDTGAVQHSLEALDQRDLLYEGVLEPPKGKLPDDWEPRPQTLFRATAHGDDTDRPLKKSDGSWTYFASDIAYHLDKFQRGFTRQINVWGADHGGYVKRMQAAVKAVTDGQAELDVKLCQLVNLLDHGEPVKMSKRAGTFVTLREVVDKVGRDVVRFVMLTRRNDQTLDFDFAKVVEQSKDNPVFYVQYAHARICSVFRHAADPELFAAGPLAIERMQLADADLNLLDGDAELDLIKRLADWPRTVESAALAHEPHRLAIYMVDLAARFHQLWTRGREDATLRFLDPDHPERTRARLALLDAIRLVIASGLEVFGVTPAEEMR